MATGTTNPPGSDHPLDLRADAKNLDLLLLAPNDSYPDRLGVPKRSWAGINSAYDAAEDERNLQFQQFLEASGFEYPPLAYVDGVPLQVDRSTQTIERAGNIYTVKVPNIFPFTLTGTFATDAPNLVLRNDQTLRQDLAAQNDPAKGAAQVGWDGEAVSVQMDLAKKLANYTALGNYTGTATRIELTQSGIAGPILRDPTVTVGDGGTTFLDGLGRGWRRDFSTDVKIGWFVTVASGLNDTVGLSNALNYVFANNKTLIIDVDIYTTRIAIASGMGGVICTTGRILAHSDLPIIDVYDNMLLDFKAAVTRSRFDLVVDLQNKGASGVFVRGPRCRVEIDVRNSVSADGQTYGTQGLQVSGDYSDVPFVRCTNFISVPAQGAGAMALAVTGYAKDVQVGKIVAEGGSGALINVGHGTQVGTIFVDGCLDNGIYDVAGAKDLYVGSIYAKNCPDEVVCFSFSERGRVEKVVATNCGRGVGVTNAISPSVGEIIWRVDADSTIPSGSPLYCRPNQTAQTDSLEVGRLVVRGTWKAGAPIFTFQNFGIGRVSIGEIDADLTYTDAAATKSLSYFDSLNTVMDIGKLSVIVRDGLGSLTSSDIFTLNVVPTTPLAAYSAIGGFHISNGGGVLSMRVPRVNDPKLVINDKIRIRSDIGTPFAVNEDDLTRSREFYSGTVPTTGDWLRDDTVWRVTPTSAGYMGWVCVASGAPGTWKQFGTIES